MSRGDKETEGGYYRGQDGTYPEQSQAAVQCLLHIKAQLLLSEQTETKGIIHLSLCTF